MYKDEYWFNGKLEKTFSFSTGEKATEFYGTTPKTRYFNAEMKGASSVVFRQDG